MLAPPTCLVVRRCMVQRAALHLGLPLLMLACASPPREQPAESAPPPLVPRSVWLAPPRFVEPQLSPDGERILAFAERDGQLRLCVQGLTAESRRPLFQGSDPPIGKIAWSYDSHTALFLSDQGGNENFHLLAVDTESAGAARDLTPIPGVKVDDFFLSPRRPGQAVVAYNARNPELMDLALVDLASGTITLHFANPGDVTQWILTPELDVAGCVAARPAGGGVLRIRNGDRFVDVLEFGVGDNVVPLGTNRDGSIFYLRSNVGRDTEAVVTFASATKQSTLLCADPGEANSAWRVDVKDVVLDVESGEPLAASFNRDRARYVAIGDALAADLEWLEAAQPGELRIESRDLANRRFVVSYASDAAFPRYLLFERGTRDLCPLADGSDDGAARPHSTTTSLEIRARDGLMLPAYLTLPTGFGERDLPLVLLVHGGPWARDEYRYDSWVQLLGNRGYAVLRVNFRGSVGFGKAFANRARKAFGREMQTDLLDAVNAMIERGIADPKRIAIMGASYGGYATLMGLATSPDVYACGVDMVGPTNLITLVESFPPDWKPFLARRWYPFVGDPSNPADRVDMESRSPLFKVDSIRAPLLIAQGANDPRVKQVESERMVAALRAERKQVEYLVFPNEGHGFQDPAHMDVFAAAVESFLARHLSGRSEACDDTALAPFRQ